MARQIPYFLAGVPMLVADTTPARAAAVTAGAVAGFEYANAAVADMDLMLPVLFTDRELREKIGALGVTGLDGWTSAELAIEYLARKGLTGISRLEVTACDPDTGVATDPVTIEGAGFSYGRAGTPTVTIGGVAATSIVVVSDTEITCVAPAHANGAVDVVVTNEHGAFTLVEGFEYDA